jgi:hypothetical protein
MDNVNASDVERRLRNGEWLGSSLLSVLFDRDRTTIYRWAKRGILLAETDPTGRDLYFDPDSALALLDRFRARRRPRRMDARPPDPPPAPTP